MKDLNFAWQALIIKYYFYHSLEKLDPTLHYNVELLELNKNNPACQQIDLKMIFALALMSRGKSAVIKF